MKAAAYAEMPDGQLRSIAVDGGRRHLVVVQEPVERSVNGETLLSGFRHQASFGFQGDVETQRAVLLFLAYRMRAGVCGRVVRVLQTERNLTRGTVIEQGAVCQEIATDQ